MGINWNFPSATYCWTGLLLLARRVGFRGNRFPIKMGMNRYGPDESSHVVCSTRNETLSGVGFNRALSFWLICAGIDEKTGITCGWSSGFFIRNQLMYIFNLQLIHIFSRKFYPNMVRFQSRNSSRAVARHPLTDHTCYPLSCSSVAEPYVTVMFVVVVVLASIIV